MFRVYCLVVIFLGFLLSSKAESISLSDAIDENLISINISENENSTHYYAPFKIKVISKSKSPLSLKIENGTLLIADQEEYQNFIITDQKIFAISSFQTREVELMAMCIEQSDRAPNNSSTYKIGAKAKDDLCLLSQFVEDNRAFEPDAQFLIWKLAQNSVKLKDDEYFVLGNDNEIIIAYKDENGKQINREIKEEGFDPEPELKVYGNFSLNLGGERKIHIAMFNMENVLVKELYNNPKTPKGENKIRYAFNSLEFPDEQYQLKVIMNGRIMMHEVVTMDI